MYKKVIIQLLLTAILFGISIFVFFKYFTSDEKEIKETNKEINKIISSEEIDSETGTLIKGLKYTFVDPSGNYYELFSETGKVDIKDSDKIFMTDVKAFIYLENTSQIKIVSKYANYNKVSHETNFFENVELTHLIHKATSENLDISFINNTASMYNNIIYNKPGTNLRADRLEIDLITKNTKMFMNNEGEKIKIINSE